MNIFGLHVSIGRKPQPSGSVELKTAVVLPSDDGTSRSVKTGRVSDEDVPTSMLDLLKEQYAVEQPEFAIEFIGVLEHLAKFNPELSFALENIVQLANTDHTVYFEGEKEFTENQIKAMREEISRVENSWYGFSTGGNTMCAEGMNSLRNDLLTQAALSGAVSVEACVNRQLNGVNKVVLIAPKNIRFKFDKKKDVYVAYQKLSRSAQQLYNLGGLIELNPITHKYSALRRINGSPYGIPPFLSALESIAVEKDMLESFRYIIKKFGVLGFLSVLVKRPTQQEALSPGTPMGSAAAKLEYRRMTEERLDDAAAQVKKGVKEGYAVGWLGETDFKMENTSVNVDGAEKLMRLNSEMKMAGLKQDPLMLGRNYSTTEAIGRVILGKLSAQLVNYQKKIDGILAEVMYLHLILKGYKLTGVRVESLKPMIADELKDQNAFQAKIKNARDLYDDGVISQNERAQMLGWSKADQAEPRLLINAGMTSDMADAAVRDADKPDTNATDEQNPSRKKRKTNNSLTKEGADQETLQLLAAPRFRYGSSAENFIKQGQAGAYVERYEAELISGYETASATMAETVIAVFKDIPASAGVTAFEDAALSSLLTDFRGTFVLQNSDGIDTLLKDAYKKFKTNGTYGARDFAIIDYYKASDNFYLSKLITDTDTKERIRSFIREQYLDGNIPLKTRTTKLVREGLTDKLVAESWKISRIIATTIVNMAASAKLLDLHADGVEHFKVVGSGAENQCSFCAEMDGRTFSVASAITGLDNFTTSHPDQVSLVKPFVSALYKTVDELKGASDASLQSAGIDLPGYHPSCACWIESA